MLKRKLEKGNVKEKTGKKKLEKRKRKKGNWKNLELRRAREV
jgi:hypothetical protein